MLKNWHVQYWGFCVTNTTVISSFVACVNMWFIAVARHQFVYTVTAYRAQNTEHELCTSHDTIRAAWYQSEHVSNELILHTFTTGVRDGQGRSLVDTTLANICGRL